MKADGTNDCGGEVEDPSADLSSRLDCDVLLEVPRWHTGFDGEVHTTSEALGRVEAETGWFDREAR